MDAGGSIAALPRVIASVWTPPKRLGTPCQGVGVGCLGAETRRLRTAEQREQGCSAGEQSAPPRSGPCSRCQQSERSAWDLIRNYLRQCLVRGLLVRMRTNTNPEIEILKLADRLAPVPRARRREINRLSKLLGAIKAQPKNPRFFVDRVNSTLRYLGLRLVLETGDTGLLAIPPTRPRRGGLYVRFGTKHRGTQGRLGSTRIVGVIPLDKRPPRRKPKTAGNGSLPNL